MSTMGNRITDELKRLGYNSSQFSKLVGVTERAQYNYENDIRKPKTEYWEESAKIGMNVLYVITGERAKNPYEPRTLDSVTKEQLTDSMTLALNEIQKAMAILKESDNAQKKD